MLNLRPLSASSSLSESYLLSDKDQEVKKWEQRYLKDTAAHAKEVKKLDSQLVGKQIFTCNRLCFLLEIVLFDWPYSFQSK